MPKVFVLGDHALSADLDLALRSFQSHEVRVFPVLADLCALAQAIPETADEESKIMAVLYAESPDLVIDSLAPRLERERSLIYKACIKTHQEILRLYPRLDIGCDFEFSDVISLARCVREQTYHRLIIKDFLPSLQSFLPWHQGSIWVYGEAPNLDRSIKKIARIAGDDLSILHKLWLEIRPDVLILSQREEEDQFWANFAQERGTPVILYQKKLVLSTYVSVLELLQDYPLFALSAPVKFLLRILFYCGLQFN